MIKEVMTRDVITISPDDIIEDAAKILHHNKIGGLILSILTQL